MAFLTHSSDSLTSEDSLGFNHIYTPSNKNSIKKIDEKFDYD